MEVRSANLVLKRENRACTRAFSLIELLVVIGIIALLAGIAIPSMKGIGATNALSAANRQLLQDIEFARLRAMNERTTVYMVFVPPEIAFAATNFWTNKLELPLARRLLAGPYTTYALFARRSLGDQPGPGSLRYLTEWRSLPDGVFISPDKFKPMDTGRNGQWVTLASTNRPFQYSFGQSNPNGVPLPFPLASSDPRAMRDGVPYIAFNAQGGLVDPSVTPKDELVPLTKGSIVFGTSDREGTQLKFGVKPEVIETPRGNTESNPQIHIDWLTGRAISEIRDPELRKVF